MHYGIGNLGHLAVIISFVAAFLAAFGYWKAKNEEIETEKEVWLTFSRVAFYIHAASVLTIIGCLFLIIKNHYFEYHYAWAHSSRQLPTHFMISCFWEGQEGSFLLWLFWHMVLGVILINTNKKWEAPMMTIFCMIQAFLASMILGAVIPWVELKIGSSPFVLLRDALADPVFTTNPDFVPEDGTGLNPLLQNYWMVIHPPTLFLGFASTIIPFAYCMAGLWIKDYKGWIKPALPWALFSAMILGTGILMGGYWAYETLNFGGYWNWDPVENASYVPWLVLVASYHTMITFKKSNTALKSSIVLVISMYILILYSTFLTRSGILGESSVHSFTDLGLSGQLLLYLLFFSGLAIINAAVNWKAIPTTEEEISTYSREFWIFLGAATLCMTGFQVLVPTSIPVYNSIAGLFGVELNMAPPADAPEFYSRFQLWFAIAIGILSGTGQFFFWKRMDPKKLMNELTVPLILTLILTGIALVITKISDFSYILLLMAGIYTITANTKVLLGFMQTKVKLAGGAIAHIGVGLMLIGILFSSGYSNVVSINNTGLLLLSEASEKDNLENLLLWKNEPSKMAGYDVTFKGHRLELDGFPDYVESKQVSLIPNDPFNVVVTEHLEHEGSTYYHRGDTAKIYPENIYFEIEYGQGDETAFTLYPRVQVNPTMGSVPSPGIKRGFGKDLYTFINWASILDEEPKEWSEPESYTVKVGERFVINDYIAELESVGKVEQVEGVPLVGEDISVQASIRIFSKTKDYVAKPYYIIKDRQVGRPLWMVDDLGIKLFFENINPEDQNFTFNVSTTQKDFVILKAMEKPYINLLWSGTLILLLGFMIAIYRRYTEFMRIRD